MPRKQGTIAFSAFATDMTVVFCVHVGYCTWNAVADPAREERSQEFFRNETACIAKGCHAMKRAYMAGGLGPLKGPRSSGVFDA